MIKNIRFNTYLFISVFIALCTTFSYYSFTFFIGNHDWDWVKGTSQVLSLSTGLFEARFGKFILNVLLFSGHIFPILNNLISFLLLSIGAVLICKYLNITQTFNAVIVSFFITLSPYILGWLYFPINILGNFSAVVFVPSALLLIESKNKIYTKPCAILLLILALGVYPSTAEMMFILFATKNILTPSKTYKQQLANFSYIFISLIAFKLLIIILSKLNIVYQDHYNMQTNSIFYILTHIITFIKLFFSQLFITLPFFPISLKLTGALIVLLAFVSSFKNLNNIIQWLIIFFATIFTSVLTTHIDDTAFMPRVNFYGLNFLYASSIAILLSKPNKYKNLGFALAILYILLSINQNFYAQKVWNLGLRAEINLTQRISKQIEDNNPKTPLIPVFTDELSLRYRYYNTPFQKNSPYLLERSFIVRHIPSGMYNFYSINQMFYGYSQIRELTPNIYSYLENALHPWPHKESIYQDDTYAIIMLTKQGIKAIQSQLPK